MNAVEKSKNVREFVISREFDAPRDLVWKAWSDSEALKQWFGPKGFKTFHAQNDPRPGGTFHYGMRAPNGSEMWGKWTYREIVRPERLVWIASFSDKAGATTKYPTMMDWPREMLTTATFEDRGSKTLVTLRSVPINASEAEIETFNDNFKSMQGGWTGTFEQLASYLDIAGREIATTRVFNARRELVWKMWTDPAHLAQWWGPNGFTTTTSEMNVRPGGRWIHVMRGPDGRDYPNEITYAEVLKPERLVYDHGPAPKFHVTVNFKDLGGKTEVSMQMLFETKELRDGVVKAYGAVEGMNQTLSRLEQHLAKPSVTLTRLFDARRDVVFRAWTDPKQLAQWWGPHGFTNPVCEIDARPGGALRIDMKGPDGNIYPMTGTFREVVPPERLAFIGVAMEGLFESLTTVTFEDVKGKTRVTVKAVVLKAAPEAAPALAGMEEGWSQSLERLDGFVRTDDRALIITRLFDAPRELLFDAWTKAEHLERWFAPKGFTSTFPKVDVRPGGAFHYCMNGPDGTKTWGLGVFREITRPDRIVYVDSFSDAEGNVVDPEQYGASGHPAETVVTITFTEEGPKTRVTLAHEVPASFPQRDEMRQGWSEMLDRLDRAVG